MADKKEYSQVSHYLFIASQVFIFIVYIAVVYITAKRGDGAPAHGFRAILRWLCTFALMLATLDVLLEHYLKFVPGRFTVPSHEHEAVVAGWVAASVLWVGQFLFGFAIPALRKPATQPSYQAGENGMPMIAPFMMPSKVVAIVAALVLSLFLAWWR